MRAQMCMFLGIRHVYAYQTSTASTGPFWLKCLNLSASVSSSSQQIQAMAASSWVDQVHATEQLWIDLMSLDGDLLVESLANLPTDLHGRLEQVSEYASRVRNSLDHGTQLVVDTGLGTAEWRLKPSWMKKSMLSPRRLPQPGRRGRQSGHSRRQRQPVSSSDGQAGCDRLRDTSRATARSHWTV